MDKKERAKIYEENEATINEAIGLLRGGRYEEALEIFLPLDIRMENSAVIKGLIGDTLSAAGRIEEASKYYGDTVTLSPKSRLASLGLFHTQWKLGMIDAAANEAIRYDSSNYRTEYIEILEEIEANGFDIAGLKDETISSIIEQLNRYPNAYRSKSIQDFDFDGTRPT